MEIFLSFPFVPIHICMYTTYILYCFLIYKFIDYNMYENIFSAKNPTLHSK